MRTIVGIQARSNSTRFPGKIYEEIGGKSILERVFRTCVEVTPEVVILGPKGDTKLEEACIKMGAMCRLFPNEGNVLGRYMGVMEDYRSIVRVTSDCWNIPFEIVDQVFHLIDSGADYVSNCIIRSYPEGYDCQAVSRRGLKWISEHAYDPEHLFSVFEGNQSIRDKFVKAKLKFQHVLNEANPIFKKYSIDTPEDLENARRVYESARKR